MAGTTRYTDAGISPRTNVYAARKMLEYQMPVIILDRFGDIKPMPKNKTTNIKFRRPRVFEAVDMPLVEGVTPSATQFRYEDVQGTLKQYGQVVEVTDVIEDVAEDPVLKDASMQCGKNIGRTFEKLRWGVLRVGHQRGIRERVSPIGRGFGSHTEPAASSHSDAASPEGGDAHRDICRAPSSSTHRQSRRRTSQSDTPISKRTFAQWPASRRSRSTGSANRSTLARSVRWRTRAIACRRTCRPSWASGHSHGRAWYGRLCRRVPAAVLRDARLRDGPVAWRGGHRAVHRAGEAEGQERPARTAWVCGLAELVLVPDSESGVDGSAEVAVSDLAT